jgi:hypothetical protein
MAQLFYRRRPLLIQALDLRLQLASTRTMKFWRNEIAVDLAVQGGWIANLNYISISSRSMAASSTGFRDAQESTRMC